MTKPITTFLLILLLILPACVEIPEIIQQPATPAPPTATPLIIQATPTLPVPLPTATQEIIPSETAAPSAARADEPALQLAEIAMFDASNGWANSEEALYRSADGGQTWQSLQIALPEAHTYFSATFLDAQTGYVVSTDLENPPSLLSITRDGGQTWAQVKLNNLAPTFASLVAVSPETLFLFENLGAAAGSQGVALSRSLDGGQTWEQTFAHVPGDTSGASLPFGGQKSLPAFLDSSLGFIGGSIPVENNIYFYRSEDGGRNWLVQPLPVPAQISGYMAMVNNPIAFPGNSEHILVPVHFSLPEGSQFVFFASADRGQTWQASSLLIKAEAYQFIDLQTGWVWSDGTLQTTRDGGQTWLTLTHNLPANTSLRQINFIDPQTGWALAFDLDFQSRLYFTSDGGQTWSELYP